VVYNLLEKNTFIGCPSLTSRNARDGCKIAGTKKIGRNHTWSIFMVIEEFTMK